MVFRKKCFYNSKAATVMYFLLLFREYVGARKLPRRLFKTFRTRPMLPRLEP